MLLISLILVVTFCGALWLSMKARCVGRLYTGCYPLKLERYFHNVDKLRELLLSTANVRAVIVDRSMAQ